MARTGSARRLNAKVQTKVPTKVPTKVQHEGSRGFDGPELATNLDRLLHDRMRLGIVSALAAADQMSFSDLKSSLNATDGNLSVHARKLEEAGYVACEKTFAGRTPRTEYKLTGAGRRALEKYLDHMDAIIKAARST